MQETLSLYRQFYDRPICLPSLLASELSSDASSDPVYQQVLAAVIYFLIAIYTPLAAVEPISVNFGHRLTQQHIVGSHR